MGKDARSSRKRPLDPSHSHKGQLKKKPSPAVAITTIKSSREKVMNNNLVMDKIARNLTPKLLWDLRRSSKVWNGAFIPQLKEKQSQVLFNGKSRSLMDLVPVIESSSNNPFTNYCFELDSNGSGISQRDLGCFPTFISAIGHSITKLDLSWKRAIELSITDLRKIIFELTPQLTSLGLTSEDKEYFEVEEERQGQSSGTSNPLGQLPKLKEIGVEVDVDEDSDWANVAFRQLTSDVIQAASELESLHLYDGTITFDFIQPIIDGLVSNITTRSHISKLKCLELNTKPGYLFEPILHNLVDLATSVNGALQLEKISFDVTCLAGPDVHDEAIENFRLLHSFLATQSPTLKNLKIDFGIYKAIDIQDLLLTPCLLPRMPHLEQLKLLRCGLSSGEIEFGVMSFMYTLPRLKRFVCEYTPMRVPGFAVDLPDLANSNRFHHTGVKKLVLSVASRSIGTYKYFNSFCTIFPSLTRLELTFTADLNQDGENYVNSTQIDTQELSKIWTAWPALTALHMTWKVDNLDLDLDTFVSGIPRNRLDQLRYEHSSLFPGAGGVDGTLDNTLESLRTTRIKHNKTRAGISDLNHLREFSITFEDETDANGNAKTNDSDHPRLTDMGGYCGIALASPTLQEVTIQGSGKNLLSEQCLAHIRSKFGIAFVIDL